MQREMKIGLGLSLLAIPVLACGGCVALLILTRLSNASKEYIDRVNKQAEVPSKSVTAEQLWDAFDSNALTAEDSFRSAFVVKGTVDKIDTAFAGDPRVILTAGKRHSVWCIFSKDYREQAASLRVGESVSILGREATRTVNVVVVKECRFGM